MLRLLSILGVAMLFSGCSLQNSLLYYPDTALPSLHTLNAHEAMPWPSTLESYRGLLIESRVTPSKGTILVFHGNAGRAADRFFYGPVLNALGYRVLLVEYPGYGGRKGALGEKSFVEEGEETLKQASFQFGGPLYLLGESLGCGVAASIAKISSVPIAGIILITPWDTLKAIAREKFPLLPVGLFLTDTYDTLSNLQDFKGPIAVVGAGEDEILPVHHAEYLYESLPSTAKKMWKIEGAGHNDWMNFTDQEWWKTLITFVASKAE